MDSTKSLVKWLGSLLGGGLLLSASSHAETPSRRVVPKPLPNHPGNIFLRGEAVEIPAPPAAGATGWVCVDYEQKVVATGSGRSVKPGDLRTGYYEVWATDASGQRLAKTTVGVLEPLRAPTPEDSPICLDVAAAWFNNPRDGKPATVREAASEAALAGVNRVRDRLRWDSTEPQRGQFAAQTFYDETARVQSEAGLKVLQVFHNSPPWANPNPKRMPLDLRDGYQYLKTMSARWHGQVAAWEPWNEGDIPGFGGHTGLEMATYQKAAYWAIRAGNPEAVVCENVFAENTRTEVVANFLENEPAAYYDTFNFHHYLPVDSLAASYAEMRQASGGKPIWVSEAGTHTEWSGEEKEAEPNSAAQQRQARYVTQCFATTIHEGSRATYYFMLPHYVEGRAQFGLTHRDLSPRPGYLALAAAGRFLAGAKPVGRVTAEAGSPLRAYLFRARPDGVEQVVLVAWAESGNVTLPLPTAAKPSAAYDFLGRTSEALAGNISVGVDPVYVLFPAGSEKKFAFTSAPVQGALVTAKPCPVVLQALIPAERIKLSASAFGLARHETLEFPVFAYNFSDHRITAEVKVDAEAGLQVTPEQATVVLQPLERKEIRVRVSEGTQSPPIRPLLVRFRADCGAQGQALTVARIVFPVADIPPVKAQPITSAQNPANWRKMVSPGQMTLAAAEGGLLVDATFQPGDRWVYPVLTPAAKEAATADWNGLAFTIVPLSGQADFKAIFDEAGGSSYLTGADLGLPLEMNKPYRVVIFFKQCKWGSFSKPDATGKFDPEQIRGVKIGCNTADEHVRYIVRDMQWVKYQF